MEEVLNTKNLSISVIVPVFREGAVINNVIDHIHQLHWDEKPEIIVVDGDPEEKTLKAIVHEDVRKLVAPRGRGGQMNRGAEVASGEILLFLHADTELPADALELIWEKVQDDRIVAGAFDLGIKSERFVFRVIERAASIRSRFTKVPFGDQAIFIRRNYFNEIGGYLSIPLMEDVEIMGRIKERGDDISIIAKRVLTSSRRWEKEGILYCTLRNWILQILYLGGISPQTLARLYKPHG